jgi:4-hydroxy-2-oxoheptanedioate aldolase
MMNKNFLKQKLLSGKPVLGTWSIIPSSITTDIIASTGLDFIIIDAEHGPISFETAQKMAIVCESRGVSPVMRLGSFNESDILKALDIGIHCIQIPNVKSINDVNKIVKFCKYPPQGERGFSPFTRAGNYSINNSTKLTKFSNKNTLIAINIEGTDAIENIDKILKVEEIDIIFIGLFDLSKALGIPGQVDNLKVQNHLKLLTNKILDSGKFPGTITTSKEKISSYLKLGIKYIVHLVDCEILSNSYREIKQLFDKESRNE